MPNDIDAVFAGVIERLPEVKVQQLQVTHEADDDGLWFFALPGSDREIQIESSTYDCPFLVENDEMGGSSDAMVCNTVQEAIEAVVSYLESTRRQ